MCGLVGFLGGSVFADRNTISLVRGMADTIVSRGPDSEGAWLCSDGTVALGHRRLAILDLSPAGHQPMESASGRYVIAFNGEIYNHLELRRALDRASLSPTWRGHSDTETLLAGFSAWGVRHTIERCIGMFAFAVWDRDTRLLTLGRDRLGEKPLYFGWQGEGPGASFLFGSELKALKAHPAFCAEIDRGALSLLMRHNYIPAPYSIYKGISKLQPGSLLTVSLVQREPVISTYWSAAEVANKRKATFGGTAEEAADELEKLLKSAVGQQMAADVPLGAFLSGGIDSSTIVAVMQAQSNKPVRTFTIGFNEDGYDEAIHARAVAKHLGTEHTEFYVTPQQALDVIPRLPGLYCEPFADSSQVPTFLVSQLARKHVTVSLSGDAGDELFCGYTRYMSTARLWSRLSSIPREVRRVGARCLTTVSPEVWNRLLHPLRGGLPSSLRKANIGDKLHKGADILSFSDLESLYRRMVSLSQNPVAEVVRGIEPPTVLSGNQPSMAGLDAMQRMMLLDTLSYLPDDILVKVDRAAMGVSLETRVPFLDHRVFEFAWSLPQSMKCRDGIGKWLLRQVLYRHVPRELIERPKMGFGIPIDAWLRGPLRDWAESLIGEERLRREGYFHSALIRQRWDDHISGRRNWHYYLWTVLMFQAWLDEWHS